MMPVIPCSVSNISFVPETSFITRKDRCFTKYNLPGNRSNQSSSLHSRRFITLPRNVTVFPHLRNGYMSRIQRISATGTEVAVEEQDSLVAEQPSGGPPKEIEANGEPSTKSDVSAAPRARRRQGRKSEMPPIKDEDLVPGATFTGKVRSIQPFGAFVDFGAFTDGLVHVSRLSNSFVKDVNDVVSVGQEVKVTLVEMNSETGRISLSMRDSEDNNKPQQNTDVASGDKPRSPRRNTSKPAQRKEETRKTTKFVKGQDLAGTVKNFGRSGAFISLPEGEEGFLPTSEEEDDGFGNVMGNSSLEVGQEVNVRVLRISRGQVTLTMKKEEDVDKLDSQLKEGVFHTATNPFAIAFRRNKDIAAYLDEREQVEELSRSSAKTEATEEIPDESVSETSQVQAEQEISEDGVDGITDDKDESLNVQNVTAEANAGEDAMIENLGANATEESSLADISKSLDEEEIKSEDVDSEVQTSTPVAEDSNTENSEPAETIDVGEEVSATSQVDTPVVEEIAAEPFSTPLADDGDAVKETSSFVAETQTENGSTIEEVPEEEAPKDEAEVETSTPEGNGSATGSSGGPVGSSTEESVAKGAVVSPAVVKQLRDETGAGMMDCKKALAETGGDLVKAQDYLRKKGLASADKKVSRATAEGRIGSYIHDSRIGVLIEVNCETDFVSRGDIFRELVDDLAMQVAACPQVEYLSIEDVPKEIVDKETEMEMQKEDLLSKPEQFRAKIVEGRVRKRLADLVLLEQPFIKNDKVTVGDWVKQTISTIGENMKVGRFVKYVLGEGLEKKSQNFAAEVAAQTAAKPTPLPEKEQPAAAEAEKPVEKAPAVAVSAALVKQLREETGAGMMDCKKALAETGGDLENAQEYLRKKGLSSADKKSSRLAAEGRIGSYIHDARIGVLIEVNCETDFVGRGEIFKELVDDLAMQVAACPLVQYVSVEDIPESIVNKEKEIEMQRDDIQSKPENIREKIVQGRISKRLGEVALLEQPFIKNDSILVKDLVKQTVASLGENIKVRRFARFTLGEQTETSSTESEA